VLVGGHRVDLLQRDQLEGAVSGALAGERAPLLLASANLDHVYRFEPEANLFGTTDAGQWLVLLDGMPLVWACRRKTGQDWEKLAGSDLLPALLAQAEATGASVGFLGGPDSLRQPLATAIATRWADLRVSGHWTPPREVVCDDDASGELADDIRAAGTDILVVGLGKPRQEEWMARHAGRAGARVTAAFGASAEFIAGTQKRAPAAFSHAGLEWLYRLAHDPRRLARRYLAEGPVALARVARSVSVAEPAQRDRVAA
jgi:N-acetylglucosaminyldiphosphoundecaprenol N-acetyl-beta-D-mannosaminyltransferase